MKYGQLFDAAKLYDVCLSAWRLAACTDDVWLPICPISSCLLSVPVQLYYVWNPVPMMSGYLSMMMSSNLDVAAY
jgi:hypothetical protein